MRFPTNQMLHCILGVIIALLVINTEAASSREIGAADNRNTLHKKNAEVGKHSV